MTDVQARVLRTASDLLGRELSLVDVFTGGQHATTLLATDGDSEFVVRAFPAHHDAAVREAEVLGRLSTLGAWVPRLIAVSNELVDPVIVTSRVFGSAPAADLSPMVIAAKMAAALVRIHELDPDGLRPTPGGGHDRAAQQSLHRRQNLLGEGQNRIQGGLGMLAQMREIQR